MHLGYIIIYVADVPITISFYEKAFGVKLRFLNESDQYAEMEMGNTTLAFVKEQAAGVEIAFVVANVEEQFKRAVDAGAIEVVKPTSKPWGSNSCLCSRQ